jgi:hypothetical protein
MVRPALSVERLGLGLGFRLADTWHIEDSSNGERPGTCTRGVPVVPSSSDSDDEPSYVSAPCPRNIYIHMYVCMNDCMYVLHMYT